MVSGFSCGRVQLDADISAVVAGGVSWQPRCVGALRRVITPWDAVEVTAVCLHGVGGFWSGFFLFSLLEWDIKSRS